MLRTLRLIVIAVALAACSGGAVDPTTTTSSMAPPDATASTTSAPPATTTTSPVDPGMEAALRAELDALIAATEAVRGLPFLQDPRITILDDAGFAERITALLAEAIDSDELTLEDQLLTLLGMLDPALDLERVLRRVLEEQIAGFYDGETRELVVPAAELTAYDKTVIVHELIHALTDQHFEYAPLLEQYVEEGRYEEAAALQALGEGDATYFQLVYLQELPLAEQFEVATEALSLDLSVLEESPAFLQADLAFPYDEGFRFVEALVASGGIAAVDRAYEQLPTTTEHILHPERYLRGEPAVPVALPETSLTGYTVEDEGIFGELEIRLVLLDSTAAGLVTQVADGWGGDAYRVLAGPGEVAFVLRYVGDTERDAIEVTEALIAHVRSAMNAGEGATDGAGMLFAADDYVYLDRDGDGLLFIAASDPAAGAELRALLEG